MNAYNGQASAAYRQAARAVHPTVAVVKCYDEALLALRQAIRAREAGEHEACFSKVLRTATVLRGLAHCLDYTAGGAVAERLAGVYKSYILALHLNYGKPDFVQRYGKLMEGLIELRDAWAGIAGVAPYAQTGALDAETAAAFRAAADRSALLRDAGPATPAGLQDAIAMQLMGAAPPPAAPAARPTRARRGDANAARPTLRPRPAPGKSL
jgi:flagellar protein FliS